MREPLETKRLSLLRIIAVAAVLFFTLTARVSAEEKSPAEETTVKESAEAQEEGGGTGLSKKISLDLRGLDIIDTLKFLGKQGDLNIVATKNVSGKVTLFLNEVSIADILDIILLTNKLAFERKGEVIIVMTEAEYEALHGQKYMSNRQTKTIALKYSDAKRVGTILGNLRSTVGKVIVDSATGVIILIDTPEKIKEMEEAVKLVDLPTVNRIIPTTTETFELEYAKVADIKGEISNALTPDIGTLRADERTNKLVVTDLPHNIEIIRNLIAAFDDKTKSVLVEAKIIEVTLNDDYASGVNWQKLMGGTDDLTFTGSFPFVSPASTSSSFKAEIGTFASDKYEFAIELIKSVGRMETISAPHIVVCNNQEAKFMVGVREAYVTSTVTTGEVTTTTSENVEFIDVGVTLYVTPTINKGGFIRMHIKPEISSVNDTLETTEGNIIPIVATANVETDVLIQDGRTIIIAGLMKSVDDKDSSRVPILGNIPFLGTAFKKVSDITEKTELVIFLTPRIISGEEDIIYLKEGEKQRKPAKQ